MKERLAVVLAAGQGTRMKSKKYKVLHPICGLPMIEHIVRALEASNVENIVTIVGNGAEEVKETLGDRVSYAYQLEQLGTAHAVMQATDLLSGRSGSTLVICGDTPLLTAETLTALFNYHESTDAKATILTATVLDPTGYGRIVRDENGLVTGIVEHRDASSKEREINEINTGTYIFDNEALFNYLPKVDNDNDQEEFYLPDVVSLLHKDGELISAYEMADPSEGLGVNDRVQLAKANEIMQIRIIEEHMRNGVTFTRPTTVVVEADVTIGNDTVIEAGVVLKGDTSIGEDCLIGANTEIINSQIEDGVEISHSVIEYSKVSKNVTIGPYAHLRPNSSLDENVHIGNFVEVKNANIGKDTRAGHLSYLGDVDLGERVNVGAGTIFVNYDGVNKHRSTVGDDAFIGCDTKIISPVEIQEQTVTGAGSVITRDVNKGSLGIARTRQENIENYWNRFVNK